MEFGFYQLSNEIGESKLVCSIPKEARHNVGVLKAFSIIPYLVNENIWVLENEMVHLGYPKFHPVNLSRVTLFPTKRNQRNAEWT